MRQNLIKNFFSSGLQALAVQVLGVTFFLIISFYLPKDDFGIISWANAVSMLLATVLSFGLDQVVTRRIAASDRSDWAASAFLFHALAGSIIALLILIGLSWFFADDKEAYRYLPWFFAAQAVTYIAAPLKQYLNAKQRFGPYGIIALCSNLCKIILAFVFITIKQMTIHKVYVILIICAGIEFFSLLYYVTQRTKFKFEFRSIAYFKLLREAVPQYISVLFDSSLSRMDWILLGLIATNAVTAEYSFAYRAFELSRLPIAIIAPIVLNSFAKMFVGGKKLDEQKKQDIFGLFTIEMFCAMLLPLVLNILWTPVVEYVFKGKYGSVNALQFMLLSLCIPMQFFINLLWTLSFAGKKYKAITFATITSALVNLGLNLVLIPALGGVGAALAYLITTLVQLVIYYSVVKKHIMSFPFLPFVFFLVVGLAAYYIATSITGVLVLQLLVALSLYAVVSVILKQVQQKHLHILKHYIGK